MRVLRTACEYWIECFDVSYQQNSTYKRLLTSTNPHRLTVHACLHYRRMPHLRHLLETGRVEVNAPQPIVSRREVGRHLHEPNVVAILPLSSTIPGSSLLYAAMLLCMSLGQSPASERCDRACSGSR